MIVFIVNDNFSSFNYNKGFGFDPLDNWTGVGKEYKPLILKLLTTKEDRLLGAEYMKSKELSYWIGVVQTDGSFKRMYNKKRKVNLYRISLEVSQKSVPMLLKFKTFSEELFGVKKKTWFNRKRSTTEYAFGCKNLVPLFEQLNINFNDPPQPPNWIINNQEFFGAYLAGVIDGDGDVRITRPKYPQCKIRINSGSFQEELQNSLVKVLNIGVSSSVNSGMRKIGSRTFKGTSYRLEFYVSSRNFQFFINEVLPFMQISEKREIVLNYIKLRQETKSLKKKCLSNDNKLWRPWCIGSIRVCGNGKQDFPESPLKTTLGPGSTPGGCPFSSYSLFHHS